MSCLNVVVGAWHLQRVYPIVTPKLDQHNVSAGSDSRSHAEYISQLQSGKAMRDACRQTETMTLT